MKPRIKAFIIHLERADSRLPQVDILRQTLPVPVEIITAVDGSTLTHENIEDFYRRYLYSPSYPFALSHNEIACFLSHRKAWQEIVTQELDGGFIIEDDVALTDSFSAAFALACEQMTAERFIRFPFREREDGAVLAEKNGVRLIRPQIVGLGQVAQLVGSQAAKHLLKKTATFDRPVDTTMQMFWETGIHPLSVLPGGVTEVSAHLGGSTIKKKRTMAERLVREVMRPLYRARVKALSQKNNKERARD